MANFTPTPLTTLANEAAAVSRINDNLADIADAIESKLNRDGILPNQMESDLDLNGNDLLNVRELQVETLIVSDPTIVTSEVIRSVQRTTATSGMLSFTLNPPPLSETNVDVYVDGLAYSPSVDYTVSDTGLDFTSAFVGGEEIVVKYSSGGLIRSSSTSTYDPAGTGAIQRTVQDKLREFRSVEDFGAFGDGVTDDTLAFRAAAATGRVAILRSGVTYLLSGGITLTTNSGFVCQNGMANIVLKTGSGGFNITALAGDRMGIDRCLFSASSTEGIVLSGMNIQPDGANARVIYPVRISGGCANTPARISRLRFSGFHVGAMISVNSVGNASYIIDDVFATSCGTSLGTAHWGAGTGQWTLVETDNDLVGGVHSQPGVISRIGCRNCLHTGTALTDFGQQTDCLNIAGISDGVDRKGPTVMGLYADGVGEGIDIFGSGAVIKGVRLRNCHVYGVKLTHGASGNVIDADYIENSGSAAVTLFGSSSTAAPTTHNTIRVGFIRNVGQGASFATGSAILFGGGSLANATKNTITVENVLEENARMTTVVQDGTASANNANLVEVGKSVGWTAFCSVPPANVRIRVKDSSRVRLTMSGNQTLSTGVAATVAFNTVQVDALNEAITGSNVVRCKTPGAKLVTAKIRVSGQNALDDMFLAVQLNGVNVARLDGEAPSGALEQSYDINKIIYIGEDIAGTAAADIRIVATHTGAATATILNTATMSDFEVIDLV